MSKTIRLSKSSIGEAEKKAVAAALDAEYLGMGKQVAQFENLLSDYFGRPVVCVTNGTAAIHLALQGLGLSAPDEVITQSLTYVAAFQAVTATGATPVACEVDPETLTIDVDDVEKRLTPRTRALLITHYGGGVGNLDKIYEFARSHDLRVIEDAAHAFGSTYKSRRIGSFGDVCCFSFDGIKNITSGEGGCIVADDEGVLAAIRDARLLGVERDSERRYANQRSWDFDVTSQGWRYHMSNIMAAIGVEQFERKDLMFRKRQQLVEYYNGRLRSLNSVEPLPIYGDDVVPHIFVVKLREGIDRDTLKEALLEKGIESGVHYFPNHLLSYFKHVGAPLPVTESIYRRVLTLPLHYDLGNEDVDIVVNALAQLADEV